MLILEGKRLPGRSKRKLKGPETGKCHNIFFLKLPWLPERFSASIHVYNSFGLLHVNHIETAFGWEMAESEKTCSLKTF